MHSKPVHMVAFLLMAVGGLNWLLVGALEFNLVTTIFGAGSVLAKAVYILVGVATVFELVTHRSHCSHCLSGGDGAAAPSTTPGEGV